MPTISFQNEAWRKPDPAQQIATVASVGSSAAPADIEADVLRQSVQKARWFNEVRSTTIARRRLVTYSKTPDRKIFMIDGHTVDENRVDQTVKLGDTEEWTIVNIDQQYHSFHIHQTAFMAAEINGIRQHERQPARYVFDTAGDRRRAWYAESRDPFHRSHHRRSICVSLPCRRS